MSDRVLLGFLLSLQIGRNLGDSTMRSKSPNYLSACKIMAKLNDFPTAFIGDHAGTIDGESDVWW